MLNYLNVKKLKTTCEDVDVEKGKPLYTSGGNINECKSCGELWEFLYELEKQLLYDPTMSLLSIHCKGTNSLNQRDSCFTMLIKPQELNVE